jgi:hypothetical protein
VYFTISNEIEQMKQTAKQYVSATVSGIQVAAVVGLGVSILLASQEPARTQKERSARRYTIATQTGTLVGAAVVMGLLAAGSKRKADEVEGKEDDKTSRKTQKTPTGGDV